MCDNAQFDPRNSENYKIRMYVTLKKSTELNFSGPSYDRKSKFGLYKSYTFSSS